jgi:hypothetical protein
MYRVHEKLSGTIGYHGHTDSIYCGTRNLVKILKKISSCNNKSRLNTMYIYYINSPEVGLDLSKTRVHARSKSTRFNSWERVL